MYKGNKKCDLKKKILKSLNRVNSHNKINNFHNRGERKEKNSRTNQNIRIIILFSNIGCKCPFLLCESQFTSVSLMMPSNTGLFSGPAVGQLRVSSGLAPVCSCLYGPQLPESVNFPLWEHSLSIYILHRHSLPT